MRRSTSPGTLTKDPYAVVLRNRIRVRVWSFRQLNRDVRFIFSELTDVSEEDRRREVPLDISLFERLNFARKDVFDIQFNAILIFHGVADHTECK